MKPSVLFLRRLAKVEAISFLLLMGVAMPMKYLWDMPLAVKYVGWAHGVLFIWLCIVLVLVAMRLHWPMSRSIMVFIASLVPFGPFLIDHKLVDKEDQEAANTES